MWRSCCPHRGDRPCRSLSPAARPARRRGRDGVGLRCRVGCPGGAETLAAGIRWQLLGTSGLGAEAWGQRFGAAVWGARFGGRGLGAENWRQRIGGRDSRPDLRTRDRAEPHVVRYPGGAAQGPCPPATSPGGRGGAAPLPGAVPGERRPRVIFGAPCPWSGAGSGAAPVLERRPVFRRAAPLPRLSGSGPVAQRRRRGGSGGGSPAARARAWAIQFSRSMRPGKAR